MNSISKEDVKDIVYVCYSCGQVLVRGGKGNGQNEFACNSEQCRGAQKIGIRSFELKSGDFVAITKDLWGVEIDYVLSSAQQKNNKTTQEEGAPWI